MTRSQAALQAVQDEFRRRAELLDQTDDLVSVSVVLKFSAGAPTVRGVSYHEERLTKREAAIPPVRHIG